MIVKEITSNRVLIETPAKLNLFLQVLNRRNDGYHNINSLFQAVSLFDRLEIELCDKPGIEITLSNDRKLPLDSNNLIAQAYDIMQQEFSLQQGFKVCLEKRIPIAAGLGGGSSDAAATLLACNMLFSLNLDNMTLSRLALKVGSDLPFFFSSGQALVRGRGEELTATSFPTDYWLLLITPASAVSTAEAYAYLKRGLTSQSEYYNISGCENVQEFVEVLRLTGNDFEELQSTRNPELRIIKDFLDEKGALISRMSGSGPTMFGLFAESPEFDIDDVCKGRGWQVELVRPISINASVTH